MEWSAVSFTTQIDASQVAAVQLFFSQASNYNIFKVFVDGASPRYLNVTAGARSYTVPVSMSSSSPRLVSFTVMKVTEAYMGWSAFHGMFLLSKAAAAGNPPQTSPYSSGVTVTALLSSALLSPSPSLQSQRQSSNSPLRRLDMVGDSITCGYGILGADAPCNGMVTYAVFALTSLN